MPDPDTLFLTVGSCCLRGLNRMERGRLKSALEGVRSFQESLGRHYRLGQTM